MQIRGRVVARKVKEDVSFAYSAFALGSGRGGFFVDKWKVIHPVRFTKRMVIIWITGLVNHPVSVPNSTKLELQLTPICLLYTRIKFRSH